MSAHLPKLADDPYRAWTLIKRLVVEQGIRYWPRYVSAFVLMAIAAGATAGAAYILGDVINAAYVNKDMRAIVMFASIMFVLFAAKGFATYGQAVILSRIGNAIIADNQRRMFTRLMGESIGFFADRHSSEFINRLVVGATAVTQVLNMLVTSLGRDFLTLIGLVGVMVYQDPHMAIFGFLVAPPAILLLRKMIRRVRGIAHTQFTGNARIVETLQEMLHGIRTVKAFTLEDRMQARADESIAEVERGANKLAQVSSRSAPLMESLGGMAIALSLIYGGYRVVETGATPGQFFSFMSAFLLAYEPAKRLARLNLDLNTALVGAQKLIEIVDAPASEASDNGLPDLALREGRIEFDDVGFSYRAGEPVLRNMSFVAEPGKVTALVGPSGGGKSTVLNLLLRLHDGSSGMVTIDGHDITTATRASLRRQIGYVGQDVFLFRGTIRDNIAFGKPGASDQDIVNAARAANAHDFIMSFPAGYETSVGEHGAQLSGGQRQRIAIARALIKNAPLILLDEATAALDSESERLVQDAMARLCAGRTTLVIAHRLHTISHADSIHVIEHGAVVESGRHDDLLRRGGRYAAFYRLQQHGGSHEVTAATPA